MKVLLDALTRMSDIITVQDTESWCRDAEFSVHGTGVLKWCVTYMKLTSQIKRNRRGWSIGNADTTVGIRLQYRKWSETFSMFGVYN